MTMTELITTMIKNQNLTNPKEFLKELIVEGANALGINIVEQLAINISNAIYLRMSDLLNWDLLYLEFEDNYKYLTSIVNQHLPYILGKCIKYKYKLDKSFLDGDKNALSNVSNASNNIKQGYKGFSVENQEGEFSNQNANLYTTQTDFINFVTTLGEDLETWTYKVYESIKVDLCVCLL